MPVSPEDVEELRDFLDRTPRQIPAKWLYDSRGAELFEKITALPEYYPSRTEEAILDRHASAIAEKAPAQTVIEIGAGSSQKVEVVLQALLEGESVTEFVPIDISRDYLALASERLASRFPTVRISPVQADFSGDVDLRLGRRPRLVLFLGGTLGNLSPREAKAFLRGLFSGLDSGDSLLLGVDLIKDVERLIAAYHDSQGVTEAFIRNIIDVARDQWGATIEHEWWNYEVQWNDAEFRIEMSLVASVDVDVDVPALGSRLIVPRGDRLLVESSRKFSVAGITRTVRNVGFDVREIFSDDGSDFAVLLATKKPDKKV